MGFSNVQNHGRKAFLTLSFLFLTTSFLVLKWKYQLPNEERMQTQAAGSKELLFPGHNTTIAPNYNDSELERKLASLPLVFFDNDVIHFTSEDVSNAKKLILEEDEFPLENQVIKLITLKDAPDEALRVVCGFISRYVDLSVKTPKAVLRRMECVRHLANLPPAITEAFLFQAFDATGAAIILESWKGKPLPRGVDFDTLAYTMRYSAAKALASYADVDYRARLREQYFYLEHSSNAYDQTLLETYPEIFAFNDLVVQKGFEEAYRICAGGLSARRRALGENMLKYYEEIE